MDETLTLGEMESRFVGECLLVDDPETDDELAVRCGTGRIPKDAAVVL